MTCEKMNTKVRLVLCPKCRLVLPELPEISVYNCGGCNTVLQAKHRKPDMKEADQNHEADENGLKQAECVSISTLLNENSAISTLDESSSSQSTSRINDNISDENLNTKLLGGFIGTVILVCASYFFITSGTTCSNVDASMLLSFLINITNTDDRRL